MRLPRPTMILEEPLARPSLVLMEGDAALLPPWVDQTDWGTPPDCRPGSEAKDGICDPSLVCPRNFQRNSKTGWCDPTNRAEYGCEPDEQGSKPFCGPDKHYDRTTGRCIDCPCALSKGFRVDGKGGCEFRLAGKPCCPGKPIDDPCVSDMVWNAKGECISRALPHCPAIYGPLSTYDAKTGLCVCPDGYERDDPNHTCKKTGSGGDQPPPEVIYEDTSSSISPVMSFFFGFATGVLGMLGKRYLDKRG